MNKKLVLVFFIISIVLLVSVVSYFAVFQETLGNYRTIDVCKSVLSDKCVSGYSCTSCSLITLPYSLKFPDGTVTNRVYSADCLYGSDTSGGHTACGSTVVSHVKSHCYGNDVFWFNSLNQRETLKTGCSYRCDDYTLDSARCISAPSCSAQGQSCGSPSLPSCCSGLSCQNFGCYPVVSSNVCIAGQHKCTSPNAYSLCVYADTGVGVTRWDTITPRFCPSGQICDSTSELFKYCKVDTAPPISYPVCDASGSMLCLSDAQFFNGEIVGCIGNDCPNGCVNNACVPVPKTCKVSSICSSDSVVKTTNSDCTAKVKSCNDGYSCSDGVCVKIVPPIDVCADVVCPDECTVDYSYNSLGSCNSDTGNCVYGKVELMATQCIGEPSNCTTDKYDLDCNGKEVKTASCVDGNYVYIIGREACVEKSFLQKYSLWIAGGIFLLSLVLFIVNYVPKKGGGKR